MCYIQSLYDDVLIKLCPLRFCLLHKHSLWRSFFVQLDVASSCIFRWERNRREQKRDSRKDSFVNTVKSQDLSNITNWTASTNETVLYLEDKRERGLTLKQVRAKAYSSKFRLLVAIDGCRCRNQSIEREKMAVCRYNRVSFLLWFFRIELLD